MSSIEIIQDSRATLEPIKNHPGSSISFRKFSNEMPNGNPIWHYHPEIEMVYIKSGNGKRHIANHISYYTSGDLIMIGPNVPHYGFTERLTQKNSETVIQFRKEILGPDALNVNELKPIQDLIERSSHGLSFHGKIKKKVGPLMEEMAVMGQFDRMLSTLKILNALAESNEYNILNARKITLELKYKEKDRIKLVYDYVRDNFQKETSVTEAASFCTMTVPSFCRYFKQHTGKTFSYFVNEFKVIHACKLLSETKRTVADIAFECGFNNFSHFNKQFKVFAGKSPSEYRNEFRIVIS